MSSQIVCYLLLCKALDCQYAQTLQKTAQIKLTFLFSLVSSCLLETMKRLLLFLSVAFLVSRRERERVMFSHIAKLWSE